MKKYLTTYGKPRFLGIVSLDDDTYGQIGRIGLIVARSHRGEELAEVVGLLDAEQEKEYRSMKTISEHGEGPVRGGEPVVTDLDFVRVPTEGDLETHEALSRSEVEILRTAQELVEWHQLQIKLIDAESLLDEKKLFFYFTSEQRVDFRTLVKDLARKFKTRIELRQMGVRDEARIIRGMSSCGLPCCCSYWLNQFAPIGIKMVKEQNIALNPAKISGICGRLMCCMGFEHRVYKNLWAGLPGPGSKIKTPGGNFIVISMDIAREAVRCHKPTGGDISVPIGLFAEFKQAVMNGEDWEVPEDALPEPATRRKRDCGSCRNKFEIHSLDRSLLYTKTTPAEAGDADTKREAAPGASPRRTESGDDAEGTVRKRSGRRRGRRGGRKQAAASEGQAAAATSTPRQKPAETAPRPPAQRPRPQQEPQKTDAAGDAERAKRPRRRRRRPKRPGAGGGGDSAGAAAE